MAITRDTITSQIPGNILESYLCENYDEYEFKSSRIWREGGKYEPFVYIIQEVETEMLYIGSKTAKNCLESDLGTKYFTSSNYVKWADSEFETIKIISCASNHDALILEGLMIESFGAIDSEHYYNKGFPNVGFNTSGCSHKHSNETKRKISISNKLAWKDATPPWVIDGSISDEHKNIISESNRKRWLDESYRTHISKLLSGENNPMYGKCHSIEAREKMSASRKGKKPMLGKTHTNETKRKMSETKKGVCLNKDVTCPYCKKTGKSSGMGRWHFDNCKYKKGMNDA